MDEPSEDSIISQLDSGITGLDELLYGGFIGGRMYLITGEPGTGKTTLGMHFLEAGLENDETVLFIHGEESVSELRANAAQFGIDVTGMEFLDLGPDSDFFTEDPSYDLVNPRDMEERRYTRAIHNAIRDINPDRVVVDPITQLRYTETSEHHYRKRILSFMRFLKEREITVLTTATIDDDHSGDIETRSLSDGVITLRKTADGRRIEVDKNRGKGQIDGDHGMEIRQRGLEVFPRIRPEPAAREFEPTQLRSGVSELDDLTGGGFERGTVTFVSGPAGSGKTTLGTRYLTRAARDHGRSTIYLFEERLETFTHRCRSIGIPIDELREEGRLSIHVIEPLERSAEEFAHMVRSEVETEGTETVLIDGLGGYTSTIQGGEDELERDLHALTRYLVNRGVSVFVTDAIHQITGLSSPTSRKISPIADNILFLSYVELRGSLRKVVGVLKKRTGGFEYTLREFEITSEGVRIGAPMESFHGLLRGEARSSDRTDRGGEE